MQSEALWLGVGQRLHRGAVDHPVRDVQQTRNSRVSLLMTPQEFLIQVLEEVCMVFVPAHMHFSLPVQISPLSPSLWDSLGSGGRKVPFFTLKQP